MRAPHEVTRVNVLVVGGTGFIGRVLCRVLDERGVAVTAASRSPDPSVLPPSVDTVSLDVTDTDLSDVVAGHDVVVNLVALPSHVQPRGQSHEAVHHRGTRHLLAASEATGVTRFVQLSGLGVDSGVDTAYFRAKLAAETAVRTTDLEWVIYRPSVVFGNGCAFLPFLRRLTAARVVPLPGGGTMRIQPIWVDDLAEMVADGVTTDGHDGHIYELGGPDRLTLAQTVKLVRPRSAIVPVPMSLAAAGATVADWLPGVPIGRDQYRVQRLDNTTASNDVAAFGVDERDLLSLYDYLDWAAQWRDGHPGRGSEEPADSHTQSAGVSLFERALGAEWADIHPQIRERYGLVTADGVQMVGRGTMNRIRRQPLALPVFHLLATDDILFPESGSAVPFTITTTPFVDDNGFEALFLSRQFDLSPPRTFVDTLRWNPNRGCLTDLLGRHGALAVDISLSGDDGTLALHLGTQWLRTGDSYHRLPRAAAVTGTLRDWYDDDADVFRVAADVEHPLVGTLFGYDGQFQNSAHEYDGDGPPVHAHADTPLPGGFR